MSNLYMSLFETNERVQAVNRTGENTFEPRTGWRAVKNLPLDTDYVKLQDGRVIECRCIYSTAGNRGARMIFAIDFGPLRTLEEHQELQRQAGLN